MPETLTPNIGSFQPGSRAVIRTKTVYDANGCVVALVDDRGAQTTYTYDLLDRQTSMTFQDGSTRTTVYDLANDVTVYTDENGSVFTNTYDPLGRRTAVAITHATGVIGTTAQSFQYDGLSRLTFARDAISSTYADVSFYYDSLNRLVEEVQTYSSDTRYVTHDVFTSNVATELTYPSARKVNSTFDAVYRRNAIHETTGGASIAAWQFFGPRTATVTLGNGIVCSMMNNAGLRSAVQPGQTTPPWGDKTTDQLGYDGSGRSITKRFLPSGSTTALVGFATQYDPAGNKLFERALHAESRSALYPSYDSINRLLEYQRGTLSGGGGSVVTPISLPGTDTQRTYDLDHLGNWKNTAYTPEGGSPTTEVRRHNLVNQVTKVGSTPVTCDHGSNAGVQGNGNIANDGTRIYAYDALNRLITVHSTAGGTPLVATYAYDAMGRRVQKFVSNGGISTTIANATYRYLFDRQQIVEELLDVSGTYSTVRQFVWGEYIDELIQLTAASPLTAGAYYPLQDLLYRTMATTNASAVIVEAYDYDAYGNTLMFSAAGTGGNWWADNATTTLQPMCEYLFTGRQYGPETQIYYYRARYYQQQIGRFISRDPIKYMSGMNMYGYTSANPLNGRDPYGLISLPTLWKLIWPCLKEFGMSTIDDQLDKATACGAITSKVNGLDPGEGDDLIVDFCNKGLNFTSHYKPKKKPETTSRQWYKCVREAVLGQVIDWHVEEIEDPWMKKLVQKMLEKATKEKEIELDFEMNVDARCVNKQLAVTIEYDLVAKDKSPGGESRVINPTTLL